MEEQKKEAPPEEAPRRQGGLLDNKVVLLGAIVIVQALLALAITRFVIVPRLGAEPAAAAAGAGAASLPGPDGDMGVGGLIVGLEEMIVSLQNEGGKPNYLKINVNLEVADQKTADRVRERLPELRDIVIMTLSSMRASQLLSPEGKQQVRGEIYGRLAERLPQEKLRSVYFSDLVIQ